jgi:aspartyl-tRNA(Asn)/glutamyl-tRNA(Gln) amidotransferase subunit B
MPGMLPVINEECVEQAVRTGLGLKAQINLRSVFDRKNYFYPGPAAGLSDQPVQVADRRRGRGRRRLPDGESITVGIERLHLEQDAGKSLHDQHPTMSYRRPQPLRRGADGDRLEARHALVREAKAYVTKLRSILRYLGTCDGDMEKGSCAPTSTSRCASPGEPLGTRCEIKNVNSIRFIGQAIEYEARRQIEIIEDGGAIEQETRLFDPTRARRARCAPRRRRTTTAISPIPTCCRSSSTRPMSTS